MIDDLNDYVGIMGGHPQASTPNIDEFLGSSDVTYFSNAHSPGAMCKPARSAILSGLSPKTTGIVDNSSPHFRELNTQRKFINQIFSDNGYKTIRYGKIEHDSQQGDEWDIAELNHFPLTVELEEYLESQGYVLGNKNRKTTEFLSPDLPEELWGDHKVVSAAIDYLDSPQSKEEKFFLGVGISKPHLPWDCPKKYFDQITLDSKNIIVPDHSADDLDDVGEIAKNLANHPKKQGPEDHIEKLGVESRKRSVHGYLACSAFADSQFGRLIDSLEENNLDKNTIVVLMSDHGWHLGEKDRWHKFSLWEETTRVPFGIKVPKYLLPEYSKINSKTNEVVNIASIYKTLPELALGIDVDSDYVSIVNLLTEEGAKKWTEAPSLAYLVSTDNATLRTKDFRYTVWEDGFEELYDHRIDQGEKENIAIQNSEEIEEQLKYFRELIKKYK
jgi:arylsulfatase A-like enzyme